MAWMTAAALALLACDALLVCRDEVRTRRRLLVCSLLASAALAAAAWRAHSAMGESEPDAATLGLVAVGSGLWAAGAACFLLPRCLALFPARLLCGPRLVMGIAQAVGLLLRGLSEGQWDLLHARWFFVTHLAVSAFTFAFGLLMLAIYFLFRNALTGRDPPQA